MIHSIKLPWIIFFILLAKSLKCLNVKKVIWSLVHQICARGIKYLLNTVQYVQWFASKYLKRTFENNSQVIRSIKFVPQSWTKGWRQIDKIKQNRFFYGMVYSWFFAIFYQKCQNLSFGWATGYSPSNPSIWGIFWKFPNFLRS